MCLSIDEIFSLMSTDNDEAAQQKGIAEAKKIRYISVLFQPIESKKVWENCAKVIIQKKDDELRRYVFSMFAWLQDMNWPGAELIYERLSQMPQNMILPTYYCCLEKATQTNDVPWELALKDFYTEYKNLTADEPLHY